MKFITEEDFYKKTAAQRYWKDRWTYIGEVSSIAQSMNVNTCWEIGCGICPISENSFKTDIQKWGDTNMILDFKSKTPFLDKSFDLVVALQVWEHLEGLQSQAFSEIERVGKNIILSFPYKWDCPKDLIHHQIDEKIISEWTNNKEPKLKKIIDVPNIPKRIIYVF
jgi:hypothetical protein